MVVVFPAPFRPRRPSARPLSTENEIPWSFSHYHLIVLDLSREKVTCNRQGRSMRKIFSKIFTLQEKERKK